MTQHLLMLGSQGSEVEQLRKALAHELGADAKAFAVLGKPDGPIDSEFDAAIADGRRALASLPMASWGRAASCCWGWRPQCL